jgi:hypothetical protein
MPSGSFVTEDKNYKSDNKVWGAGGGHQTATKTNGEGINMCPTAHA